MVSVVIMDNQEPNVIQYTFENLYSELKDIHGSELLLKDQWDIANIKNRFVCFVEADCLVSPNYFVDQLKVFNKLSPRVAVLSSTTAVKYWNNKVYGYDLEGIYSRIMPNRKKKADTAYSVQIAYIPGSLIRVSCLKKLRAVNTSQNLVDFSAQLSLKIWQSGITLDPKHPEGQLSRQIYVNPNATYVTTEGYVNDIADYAEPVESDLYNLFVKESI